jgi:hypothetical protein
MRFMLLQNYGPAEPGCPPMTEWAPQDIKAHIEFQQALNQELADRGELVDAQGLAGPDQARFVVSDGVTAPVITDGWWTSSRPGGPSKSPRRPRPPPARPAGRSSSPSRSARYSAPPTPRSEFRHDQPRGCAS